MTDAYRIRSDETWDQARADYLSGGLTAAQVCDRYDLNLNSFRRRAREGGWRRADIPDPEPLDDLDDDSPVPDLDQLIEIAWRRQARAAAAGRLAEARGWLRLWTTYRNVKREDARAEGAQAADELRDIRRTAEAGIAAAAAIKAEADAEAAALTELIRSREAENRHHRHYRHPVSSVAAPPAPPTPLRRSLAQAALAKALRTRDPDRIGRAQARLDALSTGHPDP